MQTIKSGGYRLFEQDQHATAYARHMGHVSIALLDLDIPHGDCSVQLLRRA